MFAYVILLNVSMTTKFNFKSYSNTAIWRKEWWIIAYLGTDTQRIIPLPQVPLPS